MGHFWTPKISTSPLEMVQKWGSKKCQKMAIFGPFLALFGHFGTLPEMALFGHFYISIRIWVELRFFRPLCPKKGSFLVWTLFGHFWPFLRKVPFWPNDLCQKVSKNDQKRVIFGVFGQSWGPPNEAILGPSGTPFDLESKWFYDLFERSENDPKKGTFGGVQKWPYFGPFP